MSKTVQVRRVASYNALPTETLEKLAYMTDDKQELLIWDNANGEYLPLNYRIEEFTPTANSELFDCPAGFKISDITFVNDGSVSSDISIGTTSTGIEILNAVTVGSGETIHNSVQELFSVDTDQTIYVSASTWTDVTLTVYVKYERVA